MNSKKTGINKLSKQDRKRIAMHIHSYFFTYHPDKLTPKIINQIERMKKGHKINKELTLLMAQNGIKVNE